MNKYVWIVLEGARYENTQIIGVHSSKKRADKEAEGYTRAYDFKRWVERHKIQYPKT